MLLHVFKRCKLCDKPCPKIRYNLRMLFYGEFIFHQAAHNSLLLTLLRLTSHLECPPVLLSVLSMEHTGVEDFKVKEFLWVKWIKNVINKVEDVWAKVSHLSDQPVILSRKTLIKTYVRYSFLNKRKNRFGATSSICIIKNLSTGTSGAVNEDILNWSTGFADP